MKLSKYASLVKGCGRCIVARVEGSGIWLGTDSALYRATELPEPEGADQVWAMLDLPEKAWNKVHMSEIRAESTTDVLGMDLSPYAAGEQDADKLKMMATHNGLWCACYRCREDGELIFFDEGALGPVMEELRRSDYIRFTARRAKNGARYLAVHDGFDTGAAGGQEPPAGADGELDPLQRGGDRDGMPGVRPGLAGAVSLLRPV